ncbi:hypothetical protein [Amycolatopsis plumensis]|uniref:hypothetical protein n=1 Tax=Amycolatopsis plumensis TaxID=236508 RepID=UPI00362123C7
MSRPPHFSVAALLAGLVNAIAAAVAPATPTSAASPIVAGLRCRPVVRTWGISPSSRVATSPGHTDEPAKRFTGTGLSTVD